MSYKLLPFPLSFFFRAVLFTFLFLPHFCWELTATIIFSETPLLPFPVFVHLLLIAHDLRLRRAFFTLFSEPGSCSRGKRTKAFCPTTPANTTTSGGLFASQLFPMPRLPPGRLTFLHPSAAPPLRPPAACVGFGVGALMFGHAGEPVPVAPGTTTADAYQDNDPTQASGWLCAACVSMRQSYSCLLARWCWLCAACVSMRQSYCCLVAGWILR